VLSAKDVAEWFIHWASSEEDSSDLTNMKLQKVLYYAQGHHLGKYGTPLFADQIEAWSHGPVVRSVYGVYKDAGSNPVESKRPEFDWDDFTAQHNDFLSAVWNSYGGFTAARLRNMSHAEPPWKEVFREEEPFKVIPAENIQKYFSTLYSR
jgi:uncharacterized phage-associated protein